MLSVLLLPFAIAATAGMTPSQYVEGPLLESGQQLLASGAFPTLHGLDLRIRLSLTEDTPINDQAREGKLSNPGPVLQSWDIVIKDGKTLDITTAETGVTAQAELLMSEAHFRRTQVGDELPQMEFLRIIQGKRSKFELLGYVKGETALSLATDSGPPVEVLFRFNGGGEPTTYVTMSYENMRAILEGRKNMKWLYVVRKIMNTGSFRLLVQSGDILDPN